MSPENLRKIAHPELEISNVNLILVRNQVNELTDRHTEILNYLELVYKHPRNVYRKFEKDSSCRTVVITDNLFYVRN